MATAHVNGVDLYYERNGGGQPLVLVHGSWGDADNWRLVAPALAERFDVVVYDRRGHSRSERPSSQGSAAEDVADLAALIETLGLAPAHVVGNSFGAAISLKLAYTRPELIRALAVHEPPLFGVLSDSGAAPALEEVRRRVGAVLALLEAGEMEQAAELFVETIAFGPGAWATLPEETQRVFIHNGPTFLDESRDPESQALDLDALARFNGPALVSDSDDSPPFFPAVVEVIARTLPDASRHTFTGGGHVPHMFTPDAYVATLSGFAARHGAAAPA